MVVVDTSFLIDVLRGHGPAVELLDELESVREPVQIPAVALFELHRGLAKSSVPQEERDRIGTVVGSKPLLPLDGEAARTGGQLDGTLAARGTPIDPEDSMIAAIASAHGEELVTANEEHVGRVDELTLVTYRRPER